MSQVIIDDIIPRTQLVSAADQTVFNTNWTCDTATDVLVYARASGVEPDDQTQLVSSSLYNVTLIGGSQTVRVTFLSGRSLDDVITIVRDTPADRMNLYINTNFTPTMLNEDFGILTLVDQQAQMYDVLINPGYNVSATIENIVDTVLPILGPSQVWAMNSDRTAIIPYTVPAGGGIAPADAEYLIRIANSDLPNAQVMGALASGFVVNTTASGVQLTRTLTGVSNQIAISNGTGIAENPAIGFANNAIFPGVEGIGIPQGTTAQRPVSPAVTDFRFNTDLIILEYWDGSSWVQISETDGVVTAEGTEFQVLVNGTFGMPQDGAIVLSLPQDIATSSSPLFLALTAGNLNIAGHTIVSADANGNINLIPNGTGSVLVGSDVLAFNTNSFQTAENGVNFVVVNGGYANNAFSSTYNFIKSRSTTIGSFVTVQTDDILGNINAYGDDGDQFIRSSAILFKATGTVVNNTIPGLIQFLTADHLGVLTLAASIDSTQNLLLVNPLSGDNGGTGLDNIGRTIDLTNATTAGYVLTSNVSGDASWQVAGYFADAVLLSPAADQNIIQHNLFVSNGEIISGSIIGPQGSLAGGNIEAIGLSAAGNFIAASYINAAGSSPTYWTYKSRSTSVGVQATVQTGDTLGRYLFFADDGTTFKQCASIIATAEGTVGTGFVPARLTFQTANSAGTVTTALTINSSQQSTFGGLITSSNGISFGGNTLSNYTETNSFSPTFTCATVGDLSVSYATRNGYVTRIGRMAFVQVDIVCTPTFTTASGNIRIGNLPYTINASAPPPSGEVQTSAGFVYAGTVTTQIIGVVGQTYASIRNNASASNGTIMLMSNIVTGVQIEVSFTFAYLI